jgi:hypothetical protein
MYGLCTQFGNTTVEVGSGPDTLSEWRIRAPSSLHCNSFRNACRMSAVSQYCDRSLRSPLINPPQNPQCNKQSRSPITPPQTRCGACSAPQMPLSQQWTPSCRQGHHVVQSQQLRPPYSPYGQTQWSKDQPAIFAFELPCIAGTAPVLEQMRNLGRQPAMAVRECAGACDHLGVRRATAPRCGSRGDAP